MVRIQTRGNQTDAAAIAAFRGALQTQCDRLGLRSRVRHAAIDAAVAPSEGTVILVFVDSGHVWTSDEQCSLDELVRARMAVLPVVGRAPDAASLPGELKAINAFQKDAYGSDWPAGLVDEVIAMAWLRRRTRKVFISYKRSDSGPIAGQLYDRLNRLGYETFLDDASIGKGLDFQRELKWWLNDADLLLVLLSPSFGQSRWCMEEIAFSQSRFVGVLVVDWPGEVYTNPQGVAFPGVNAGASPPAVLRGAMPDQHVALAIADFEGAAGTPGGASNLPARELTEAAVARVLAACARQRGIAIRQRLDNLVPLAREILGVHGPVEPGRFVGDLKFRDENSRSCFARVLPFRPQPETVFQTYRDAPGFDRVGCFYAENDREDPRARALQWLADNNFRAISPSLAASCVWAYSGGEPL